jgi:hypothetical protein
MPSVSTSLDESSYDDNEFEDDFQNVKKEAPLIHEINPTNVITECGLPNALWLPLLIPQSRT